MHNTVTTDSEQSLIPDRLLSTSISIANVNVKQEAQWQRKNSVYRYIRTFPSGNISGSFLKLKPKAEEKISFVTSCTEPKTLFHTFCENSHQSHWAKNNRSGRPFIKKTFIIGKNVFHSKALYFIILRVLLP